MSQILLLSKRPKTEVQDKHFHKALRYDRRQANKCSWCRYNPIMLMLTTAIYITFRIIIILDSSNSLIKLTKCTSGESF